MTMHHTTDYFGDDRVHVGDARSSSAIGVFLGLAVLALVAVITVLIAGARHDDSFQTYEATTASPAYAASTATGAANPS